MAGKTPETSIKPKAFAWLDANASVLTRNQLYDGLRDTFNLTIKTARVYASQWRKSNGVTRTYSKKRNTTDGN